MNSQNFYFIVQSVACEEFLGPFVVFIIHNGTCKNVIFLASIIG